MGGPPSTVRHSGAWGVPLTIREHSCACCHRFPEALHDLVRACLVLEPHRRPTALELADRARGLIDALSTGSPTI